jgi:predicted glycogen debranching enzyme
MQPLVPIMTPPPGERFLRFVGDHVRFTIKDRAGRSPDKAWRAFLRTTLGRADALRREILQAHTKGLSLGGAAWRDLPMNEDGQGWSLELPVVEPGYFKAKAYLMDERGWQHWPEGADLGISVHPDRYRTANTLYCAFVRMFGDTKTALTTIDDKRDEILKKLDDEGYAAIPPSGKLRDLIQQIPHIIETLGCRIIHLLPIHPTPTTFARFGRFGSPYAALDLTAIDPALIVFDKRSSGIDQFRELAYATHLHGGRLFLDIVINHTGWGSVLQENHPEWFFRQSDGSFASPGAWGTTWEDLVEVKHDNLALWDDLAEMFLIWCRRGVDGFRCDAGYKVPTAAWQYIVARVQDEFPETIFLLEGLGGAWEATEALLNDGGMQWAYSELFQNYSARQVSGYLDHSLKQSSRVGVLVNYSETHDNDRLSARGRAWSLLRNRLCALTSVNGGFGFTCGVEWLATEKIKVHGSSGMNWDSKENLVPELAKLNQLLGQHPCFFDCAKLTRISAPDSPVYALRRESDEGKDLVLILVNTDVERLQTLVLDRHAFGADASLPWPDLLGQKSPEIKASLDGKITLTLAAGAAFCLSPAAQPQGLAGDAYRRARAQAAWALQALAQLLPARALPLYLWRELAALVDQSPKNFLAAASVLALEFARTENHQEFLAQFCSLDSFDQILKAQKLPQVITWSLPDRNRITPVPPEHWLLLQDTAPFRASLNCEDAKPALHVESIPVGTGYIAVFPPRDMHADATLSLERYTHKDRRVEAEVRFLPTPSFSPFPRITHHASRITDHAIRNTDLALLTNGRGGMARLRIDLGRVCSKYDCVLGANLHPTLPVDRHVLAKRIRVWVNAGGFISPLDSVCLSSFIPGPPAIWQFVANAGDGRTVEIQMTADMLEDRNTTVFHFSRPTAEMASGKQLPADADVRLTVRVDIEDRNFHWETKRNSGAEHHFGSNTGTLGETSDGTSPTTKAGFVFRPAHDRQLRVFTNNGHYHPQPEWCENIPHPVEASRGQTGSGDAYSPGWFELPLPKGAARSLVVTAETSDPTRDELENLKRRVLTPAFRSIFPEDDLFGQQLLRAARAFVVRRDSGKTVIAGYPWFLDWGRDTFICARGLLAAGMLEEVKQIIVTFARFEKNGTLPNTIFGEDASNRDTSDAPLWFALVCEELARLTSASPANPVSLYDLPVDKSGRPLRDVLESITLGYINGTPNGIRMDRDSALIWSPSHFTWMDTNYPACTPREGYPIEIQALWIRLLRQLERISDKGPGKIWNGLADQALASVEKYFWLEDRGYYSDVLLAKPDQPASSAIADDALRSNCLFLPSLGLVTGDRARRCVESALRHLVVPGALRTLAPLRLSVPLPIYGSNGRLLNDPSAPYWGHYEGDEDARRKPAYHNGTAWTWTFPVFCEALARAWDFSPEAVATAKAYLGSMDRLLQEGCVGQLPEILDGDIPHAQRGCDAQAWGVTEALRVWNLLQEPSH